jgi:hypothetical protein
MRSTCSVVLAACCALCAFLFGCSVTPEDGETGFYGLVVGISDYINLLPPGPPDYGSDLKYCDDDANELYAELLAQGWRTEELGAPLLDHDATKGEILARVAALAAAASAKDYILIYFSGHGFIVGDQDGDESDGIDEAIVPADYDPVTESPLILDDELRDILKTAKTEKGLIVFDSCNSGGVINQSLGVPGPSPRTLPREGARGPGGQGVNGDLDIFNFPVFAASGQGESAFETDSLAHGVFTYFLLDGLEGCRSDENGDGKVSIRELFAHAESHTEAYTAARSWSQHPQIRFERSFLDILVTR